MTLSVSPDLIAFFALMALAIGVSMTLFYLACTRWRRALGWGTASAAAAWAVAHFSGWGG